jgi:hypothetical protein
MGCLDLKIWVRDTIEEQKHQRKSQVIKWIVDPLLPFKTIRTERSSTISTHDTSTTQGEEKRTSAVASNVSSPHSDADKNIEETITPINQDPGFKPTKDSLPIQLFYDIYFVANLSTITSDKNIVDTKSMCADILTFGFQLTNMCIRPEVL